MNNLSFLSDTQQSNTSERERNKNLTDCFVLFLAYYSVQCQTKSFSNPCIRFAMFPMFLAISKFFTIKRMVDLIGNEAIP